MKLWNGHKMNALQRKMDVTHLNSVHAFWHEFRTFCVDPASRFDPPGDSRSFGGALRKVRYFDQETRRNLVFLPNHLDIPALTVAHIYRSRWQIELFFRWIKSHLRIKHYYGTSPNAVKTQIWIAMAVYLMVAILHKQLSLPGTLYRTLQLLSVHPFEKMPVHELLAESNFQIPDDLSSNQMMLLGL